MKNILLVVCVNMLLMSCSTAKQPAAADPIPVYDSLSIISKHVAETRRINVWTPPGYSTSTDSFPIVYMPDGGLQEDFPHIANTIAALVKNNTIPPVILVGIENTQRRRDMTGPTVVEEDKKIAAVVGGSQQFRSFIEDELFTSINAKYRTINKKAIIGESLAGLFIVETFLLKPSMFDFYIAMDPSLWWNNHYLVSHAKEYLVKFPADKKRLWFAGSSAKDIYEHTNEFSKILTTENIKTISFHYSSEPKEEHSSIYRATKEKALTWAFSSSPN